MITRTHAAAAAAAAAAATATAAAAAAVPQVVIFGANVFDHTAGQYLEGAIRKRVCCFAVDDGLSPPVPEFVFGRRSVVVTQH
jgi:hypothetical protein